MKPIISVPYFLYKNRYNLAVPFRSFLKILTFLNIKTKLTSEKLYEDFPGLSNSSKFTGYIYFSKCYLPDVISRY